jgi:hypothetical protein
MNTKILVYVMLSGLLTVNSCFAVTSIALPGAAPAPAPHVTPKVQSVMSMGKLDAIDLVAKTFHINGVAYSFEGSGVRFVNTNGGAMQAAQLKAGDWVQFWIKPATAQRMPQVERVVLMVNPESRKAKP